jgi:hypothetical protein
MQAEIVGVDAMVSGEGGESDRIPTRGEVAEYLHDLVSQLANLAEAAGLSGTAEALAKAKAAVEAEF